MTNPSKRRRKPARHRPARPARLPAAIEADRSGSADPADPADPADHHNELKVLLAEVRQASAGFTTQAVEQTVASMTDDELVAFESVLTEYSLALDRLQAALLSDVVRRVMLNPGLYAASAATIQRKL